MDGLAAVFGSLHLCKFDMCVRSRSLCVNVWKIKKVVVDMRGKSLYGDQVLGIMAAPAYTKPP